MLTIAWACGDVKMRIRETLLFWSSFKVSDLVIRSFPCLRERWWGWYAQIRSPRDTIHLGSGCMALKEIMLIYIFTSIPTTETRNGAVYRSPAEEREWGVEIFRNQRPWWLVLFGREAELDVWIGDGTDHRALFVFNCRRDWKKVEWMVKQARKHKSIDLGGLALPRSPYIRQQRSFGIKGFFFSTRCVHMFLRNWSRKGRKMGWPQLLRPV